MVVEDKIKMRGTSYLLDRLRGEFVQEDNNKNRIPFNKFDFNGAAYTANIDENTKNISRDPKLKADPNVIIPAQAIEEPFKNNPQLLSMLNLYGRDHGWGIEMKLPDTSAKIIPITQASGFKEGNKTKEKVENKVNNKRKKGAKISS